MRAYPRNGLHNALLSIRLGGGGLLLSINAANTCGNDCSPTNAPTIWLVKALLACSASEDHASDAVSLASMLRINANISSLAAMLAIGALHPRFRLS